VKNSGQKHGVSYSYGFIVKVPLYKYLSLSTGIALREWNVKGTYNFPLKETPVYDHLNKEIYYVPDVVNTHYSYSAFKQFSYYQVPLNVSFELPLRKKISMGIETGAIFSFLKNASGTTIDPIYLTSQPLNGTTDLKNSYISWRIGAGLYLPIGQKLKLGIMPEYRHCTGTILNSSSGVKWYPSAVDIKTTLLFKF
jgi:hypothetical protein